MARATRERLAKDAERYSLNGKTYRLGTKDELADLLGLSACEVCGRLLGLHSAQQFFACGKKQRGITP